MTQEYLRTDALLMEILQNRKTITGFLDSIFGFLKRKEESDEKIGFPKGMREQVVFCTMQHYDPEYQLNNQVQYEDGYAPPAIVEIEIETADLENTPVKDNTRQSVETSRKAQSFGFADYKNGATFDNYCWSQSLKDVEIHVKLPVGLQSAKQIAIDMTADSITVRTRIEPSVVVFTGKLAYKYKLNDAVWTIEGGQLLISFDKIREGWWEKLLSTEEPVDLKMLDSERFIDELPEESQAAIQKLRVQQMEQDKIQGQMKSNKIETLEKLRQAWDAEDSPFRGQTFDPSIVKFG